MVEWLQSVVYLLFPLSFMRQFFLVLGLLPLLAFSGLPISPNATPDEVVDRVFDSVADDIAEALDTAVAAVPAKSTSKMGFSLSMPMDALDAMTDGELQVKAAMKATQDTTATQPLGSAQMQLGVAASGEMGGMAQLGGEVRMRDGNMYVYLDTPQVDMMGQSLTESDLQPMAPFLENWLMVNFADLEERLEDMAGEPLPISLTEVLSMDYTQIARAEVAAYKKVLPYLNFWDATTVSADQMFVDELLLNDAYRDTMPGYGANPASNHAQAVVTANPDKLTDLVIAGRDAFIEVMTLMPGVSPAMQAEMVAEIKRELTRESVREELADMPLWKGLMTVDRYGQNIELVTMVEDEYESLYVMLAHDQDETTFFMAPAASYTEDYLRMNYDRETGDYFFDFSEGLNINGKWTDNEFTTTVVTESYYDEVPEVQMVARLNRDVRTGHWTGVVSVPSEGVGIAIDRIALSDDMMSLQLAARLYVDQSYMGQVMLITDTQPVDRVTVEVPVGATPLMPLVEEQMALVGMMLEGGIMMENDMMIDDWENEWEDDWSDDMGEEMDLYDYGY